MQARGLRYLGLMAVLWVSYAAALQPLPQLKTRVTDLTGTLNVTQKNRLENKLADLEERKGSQLDILLVPTTKPETIEQYSMRVVEQWRLGRKGVDDGILLLVAKNDRTLRIEVGYGLEGTIPDALAKRIINEIITPYFRQGDYYGGLAAGVESLIGLIDGEPLPPKPHKPDDKLAPGKNPRTWQDTAWLLFLVILITVLSIIASARQGTVSTQGGAAGRSSASGGRSGGGHSGGGGRFGGGGASGSW